MNRFSDFALRRNSHETHIYFTPPLPFSEKPKEFIGLTYQSILFNIIKIIPRLFTITTKKGSYKFNIDFLKDTSSLIRNSLKENPTNLQYNLKDEDDLNIMQRVERLYLGEQITILSHEKKNLSNIINELGLIKSFRLNSNFSIIGLSRIIEEDKKIDIQINIKYFEKYVKNVIPKNFTITTKSKEYKCNLFGVYSSKIIRDKLTEDSNFSRYEYDFDNEFNEFHSICDLFNFETVQMTIDNVHSLKTIADDLQIDFIIDDINNFIDDYENQIQTVDDQQFIIDSINELFETLYNIKELTVTTVKEKILASNWIKTEENVQELVAFILQVISTDILLHSYLIELIESLDKEANETNKLEILVPFLINKLIDSSFNKNKFVCAFIFKLYKKGYILKNEIIRKLKQIDSIDDSNIIFLPEINEINYISKFDSKKFSTIIKEYKRESFEKMRNEYEPSDLITRSLRIDDIDTFQSIISTKPINISNSVVPINIFEEFVPNGETSYINYAAAYGSIKCFKYLLLNHADLNENSFPMAIFGGNIEIIKIIDQQNSDNTISFTRFNNLRNLRMIKPTIIKHQNDLFDWIIENKFTEIIKDTNLITNILTCASENGNIHSFVSLLDKGFNYNNLSDQVCFVLISNASKNGFTKLLEFISIIFSKKIRQHENYFFSLEASVLFGNLSIFQFYCKKNKDFDVNESILLSAINNNSIKIIEYIFNEIFKESIIYNNYFVYRLLKASIPLKTNEIFIFLIEKFKKINSNLFLNFNDYLMNLLSEACYYDKFEIGKIITDLIDNEQINFENDFSIQFCKAASAGSEKMCQYLIDKKYYINFDLIFYQNPNFSSINEDVLNIIIKNITPGCKELFTKDYFNKVIQSKNKNLIEFILKDILPFDDSLFEAIKTEDIDIVNIILNHRNDTFFINQISNSGTALNLAVSLNRLDIVKRLLSLPGIDPSLFASSNCVPFITAVKQTNIEMINTILDFYGPSIIYQQWQLNEAVNIFLESIITKPENLDVLNCLNEIECIDFNIHNGGYTILSYACKINEIKIVKMLIKLDKVDVNLFAPINGNSPLMIAIKSRNFEIVKLLIECDKTNINKRNYNGETALTMSVEMNLIDIVDMIINNEKFNPIESRLNYAFCMSKNEEISKKLIEIKELDVNYLISKNFSNPLILAVENSQNDLIDLIIHHPSFDPNKLLSKQAVFAAVKKEDLEIFHRLMNLLHCDINIHDIEGNSLLSFAIKNDNKEMVTEILNDQNYDSKSNNFLKDFFTSITKFTPNFDIIHEMINFDKKHEKLIKFDQNLPNGKSFFTAINASNMSKNDITQLVNLYIENGVDPNKPDKDRIYPLEYAIDMDDLAYVEALVDTGKIDYSAKIENKSTKSIFRAKQSHNSYLHLAARLYNPQILSLFLDRKLIDVNTTDSNGNTPLIEACKNTNGRCIQILFNADNLDYTKRNNDGLDALEILQKINASSNYGKKFVVKSKPKNKTEYCSVLIEIIRNTRIINEDDFLIKVLLKMDNKNNNEIKENKSIEEAKSSRLQKHKFGEKQKSNKEINNKNKLDKPTSFMKKQDQQKETKSLSNNDSLIQEEIANSIFESFDSFTHDEVLKISTKLLSIVKKEVNKISGKQHTTINNASNETNEDAKQRSKNETNEDEVKEDAKPSSK